MRQDLREAFEKAGKLRNWKIPMPTYEDMETLLSINEKVLCVIKAGINGKHVGVAILTDSGVHLLGKRPYPFLSPYKESMSLNHITGVTRQRNIMYMGYTVEISRASNVDQLLGVDKDDSEEFVKKLRELVTDTGSAGSKNVTINQVLDPLDQIRKLKDLLDSGILTIEEFEEKKKELMGRI